MNANKPGNPNAFPSIEYDQNREPVAGQYLIHAQYSGMTLRDWLAGTASHEDLTVPSDVKECAGMLGLEPGTYRAEDWPRVVAILRYRYADAMLAEREKSL